jgi:hypothetical protein
MKIATASTVRPLAIMPRRMASSPSVGPTNVSDSGLPGPPLTDPMGAGRLPLRRMIESSLESFWSFAPEIWPRPWNEADWTAGADFTLPSSMMTIRPGGRWLKSV